MENSFNANRSGMILIVSGASGTGKSTVCNIVMDRNKKLEFSISCTTRQARDGEVDGVDYHFITSDEFNAKISNKEFIEHATVHNNSYGTLRKEVMDRVNVGKDVLLDIDTQGAMQIQKYMQNDAKLAKCVEFVFIAPPSIEILEDRLRSRGTETEESIQVRLNNAKGELDKWDKYNYLIINNDLEQAVEDMEHLIYTLHKSTHRLSTWKSI